MIHANHAGTSWPKLPCVRDAMSAFLDADPTDWPDQFAAHHAAIAAFFGVAPECLLLTPGCTQALAVGIADLPWAAGDRVLLDAFAHAALHRPCAALAARGVVVDVVAPSEMPGRITADVRLVAVSAANNVTGARADVPALVAAAHATGARVLVDAAQVAGWQSRSIGAWGADLVAFAGHKGPQAPWGIGGLITSPGLTLESPRGTATGYCDTGSVDRVALAGLAAGCAWLGRRPGRLERARGWLDGLEATLPGHVVVHHADRSRVPTAALSVPGRDPRELAAALRERGVNASGGLQCAPLAHRTLGTMPTGVLRVSIGPATTPMEVEQIASALRQVLYAHACPFRL